MTDRSGRKDISWSPILFTAIALLAAASLLYRPWENVPLDVTDYSEILPLLERGDSFGDRLGNMVGYYGSHGRLNIVTSAYIVTLWELWGSWAPGWRISRTLVMALLIVFTLRLMATFRFSTSAAAAGAALLVVSQAAAANWLRLTGEPLASVTFVAALLVAAGYQRARRWRGRAALVAACVLVMVFTKETMLAAVPFVAIVGLSWHERAGFCRPIDSRRNVVLGSSIVAVSALALAPILWVAATAGSEAYARVYGHGALTAGRILEGLRIMLLPVASVPASLANWVFLCLVVGGWYLKFQEGPVPRRQTAAHLGLLLALPAAGGLVYWPWSRFMLFYALPFLLSPILLLAVAVAALGRVPIGRPWLVWCVLGLLVFVPATTTADHMSRYAAALRRVNFRLAETVADHPDADRIVVGVREVADQRWQGRAPTLRRYAAAVHGVAPPVADDVDCPRALELLRSQRGNELIVTYSYECGPLTDPSRVLEEPYSFVRPSLLRVEQDTVRAYVWEH